MISLPLLAFLLSPATSGPCPQPAPQEEEPAAPELTPLEAEFARKLSGAKLVGFFTDDRQQPGTAPSEETYTIHGLTKIAGDAWRIEAGIEYGGRSFSFPIVLDVLWAGDTPVLSLTELAIPMLGTFTARVMIHGERYAGIWSATDHGGQMYGRVVHAGATLQEGREDSAGDQEGENEGDEGGESVHWPSFRGRFASGVAEGWATAAEFDVGSGKNVRWRAEVPGLAHSSPVIWGERLFLTTAVKEGEPAELKVGLYGNVASVPDDSIHEFVVLCVDKRDGRVLWERLAWKGVPAFRRHPKGSFAASTPATDGERVVAFFGTEGLYCYDLEGELLWRRDFGPLSAGFFMMPDAQWGFGSSPVIHGERVFVQCDVLGDSFLAALDAATGEELWRTARDEVPTWSTPTVVLGGGRDQIVCNGFKHAGGYDLSTGEELWKIAGGGDIPVPTPVAAHGLIFLTSSHGLLSPIYAVEQGARGELSFDSDPMAWSDRRRGNYMQTPIAYGEEVYFCSDAGVLACYDARSGEEHYRERLGEGGTGFTASPVAADGKLYLTAETGQVHVIAAGTQLEPLAVNDLGEECMATPAISAGVVYWRSRGHVTAVAED